MKVIFFVFSFFCLPLSLFCQQDESLVSSKELFSGKGVTFISSVVPISKQHFFAVGTIPSTEDIELYENNVLLLKIDQKGKVISNKQYVSEGNQVGKKIIAVSPKEFIIVGDSEELVNDTIKWMYFIQKINLKGNTIWIKKKHDEKIIFRVSSVIYSKEKKELLLLSTIINKNHNENPSDIMLMCFDENGNKKWEKRYGGNGDEEGIDIVSNSQGYLICGNSNSQGTFGNWDFWLLQCDGEGNKLWQKYIGMGDIDKLNCILPIDDFYLLGGYTYSAGEGSADGWIVKVNKKGKKIWDRTVGDVSLDEITDIVPTGKNTFAATGYSDIWVFDEEYNNVSNESNNILFVLFKENGTILKSKHFGGELSQKGMIIRKSTDNNYIIIGSHQKEQLDILITKIRDK